jgi:CheY-like chemotaxis protein
MIQNILFVEDDSQNRVVYSNLLRNRGYQVAEANDGVEAVELLEKQVFDVVISDLVLPKLHGLNLVYEIRSRWPDVPIIVISGYLPDSEGKVILEGSAEFIQKPIKPEILFATLESLSDARK